MSEPVIKVEGLGKRYTLHHQARSGLLRDRLASLLHNPFRRAKAASATAEDFWALRDVNFTVNQGDVVGIIGRNGAGKSTLLKILSRITEPTTGRITIHGRVASLLEVGTGFHGELSGRENIFLNGAILGMHRAEIRKKFDEIVAFAEVEKFLDTPVKHYSSGMYVRLAFAVAAHLEPEILIVDEVLAVGDAAFQKKCLGKMQEVSSTQGRTVLFVSHNTAAVAQLCTTALVLNQGQLSFRGAVVDALSEYVASYGNCSRHFSSVFAYKDPRLTVETLLVNGASQGVVHVRSGDQQLQIDVDLRVNQPVQVSIEAHLRDQLGGCLGFFSPGHVNPEAGIVTLLPGRHHMTANLLLPPVHRGFYTLDIAITHPRVLSYARAQGVCRLEHEGTSTPSGVVLNQSPEGAGAMWIFGAVTNGSPVGDTVQP